MPLEAMKKIFTESAKVQRWLDIEAAVAKVEASLGIIPKEAAEEIVSKAKVELLDEEQRQLEYKRNQHIMFATLKSFQKICQGKFGEYIHWGPTTQDIMDTEQVLAIKEVYNIVFQTLREIETDLIKIAEEETETIMAGRTHGQQAVPITMGFKAAIWLRENRRNIQRLKEIKERLLVGQMNGAVGNYASFGDKGRLIEAMVCKELALNPPDISWAAARDCFAEFACLIAMIAHTLGRIAHEIYTLQMTEVGELEEPIPETRVGSSTMPHKRNALSCENALAQVKKLKYYAAMNIEGMIVGQERGSAGWYMQRNYLHEMCLTLGDVLAQMKNNIRGLKINRERMEDNLKLSRGLILSENVMLGLGSRLGKQTAHAIVMEASNKVYQQDIPFKDALMSTPTVAEHLSEAEIEKLLDPHEQIKVSVEVVKEMVALTRSERESDPV